MSRADKARCYAIARGEAIEAAAAVEIAALCGDTAAAPAGEIDRADGLVQGAIGLREARASSGRSSLAHCDAVAVRRLPPLSAVGFYR